MRFVGIVAVCIVCTLGCEKKETQSTSAPASMPATPIALNNPASFRLNQRSTVSLPGSAQRLTLKIGDITGGRVSASVLTNDGHEIVSPRSLRPGDSIAFEFEDHPYNVTLKILNNVLIGDDSADFEFSYAGDESQLLKSSLTDDEKIELLIAELSRLENAKFIRNGDVHRVDEAVEHMRSKWSWNKEEIKTADAFIKNVATGSTVSGDPYWIRFQDGTEVKSADWFREQLRKIEGQHQP